MANKKSEGIPYGSMPVPKGESRYSMMRWGWNGLNRTDTIDSGNITDCHNVMISQSGVETFANWESYNLALYKKIGVFGFDDFLIVIDRADEALGGKLYIEQYAFDGDTLIKLGSQKALESQCSESDEPRSVVQFNTAVTEGEIVSAEYVRKLLIYPDMVSIPLVYSEEHGRYVIGDPEYFDYAMDSESGEVIKNPQPKLKDVTVYAGRIFGVDDNKIYASEFNNYSGWQLDTADHISEANAWVSMTQSNARADGIFTAIRVYDNHVVLFKKDFTQLVYGDSSPFRIVDLSAFGADNRYAATEANGVLYFASRDNVYAFTGGLPKAIGDVLGISDYSGASLGYFKDKLYMSVGSELYIFRDGMWSSKKIPNHIVMFATCEGGLFGLDSTGILFRIDSNEREKTLEAGNRLRYGDWWFETDLMCGGKLDIRRAKKLSLLCDLAEGASVSVYLLKDGEVFDEARTIKVMECRRSGKRVIRGLIRGFGGFCHKLRICGTGRVRVSAAELLISWGGDLYLGE